MTLLGSYIQSTPNLSLKRGQKSKKINKQCPFLVTRDHFFAVLRARMVLSGSSITNRHTTLCYINHPEVIFFYHAKFWNNKNSHLQMWMFFAICYGNFFCCWAPPTMLCQIFVGGYQNGKKTSIENCKKESNFQIIFFAFPSFAIIEKINPIFVLTGWNQANW